jgi:hypothetical protein
LYSRNLPRHQIPLQKVRTLLAESAVETIVSSWYKLQKIFLLTLWNKAAGMV